MEEGSLLSLCLLAFPLTGKCIPSLALAYFFEIMAYTKDQLRHPALWTEQPLDSWTFCWWTATAGLAGPQSVRLSNKSPFYIHKVIHSISSAPLGNPDYYTTFASRSPIR